MSGPQRPNRNDYDDGYGRNQGGGGGDYYQDDHSQQQQYYDNGYDSGQGGYGGQGGQGGQGGRNGDGYYDESYAVPPMLAPRIFLVVFRMY